MINSITPKDLLPGIDKLLFESKRKGIKLAVASASKNAQFVLERLGILDLFDYVADAGKIINPKPHPQIFLDCSRALDVKPQNCIGLEDSQAGVEAIHAAGMFSVGVKIEVTALAPHLSVNSTEELSYELLCKAYAVWRKNGRR